MNVYGSPSKAPMESFPLWTISKAEARINAGQALRGVGDVALTIVYPGYGGRATQVLRGVPETDRAAAMISRHARLTRLRQGVGWLTGSGQPLHARAQFAGVGTVTVAATNSTLNALHHTSTVH